MLDKHMTVLFTQEMYDLLQQKAEQRGESMGALIREAVEKIYVKADSLSEEDRYYTSLIQELQSIKKENRQSGSLDYKAMIEEGRL
jgi:hypothetical protein